MTIDYSLFKIPNESHDQKHSFSELQFKQIAMYFIYLEFLGHYGI